MKKIIIPKCIKSGNPCIIHKNGKYIKWSCGDYDVGKVRREQYLKKKKKINKRCLKCNKRISPDAKLCSECSFKDIERRLKTSKSQSGDKAYNWKGGIEPENKRIRKSIEFRLWREAVFARDNWICQKTGIKGSKLHPHHIHNFADYPELRFAIDNGITFSENAHREFHRIYGRKNNTKKQLEEFLSINNLDNSRWKK